MIEVFERIRCWYRHRDLLRKKILVPIKSYEEYIFLIKEFKTNSKQKIFTNCYIMPNEAKRLISLGNLYVLKTNCGLVFADDEGGYYYLFLYVDMLEPLKLPIMDKDILVENVYYEGRKTEIQIRFEEYVQAAGCVYFNTYNAITDCPQIEPEKYWKQLAILEKALESEGKKISIPNDEQLREFENVYRETIDKYVQKRYSLSERKHQRNLGHLLCVDDEKGNIYAIHINETHGGAVATRKDCQGGIYSPALMMYILKRYYEYMPKDEVARKEYMRSKRIGGWIAVDNTASWRMHKMLGFKATNKSMNQFVVKSTM